MNDAFKKFSEEAVELVSKMLESEQWKSFADRTKDAGDSGTFEMVITTSDVDRSGESIIQEGVNITQYMKNPIVLWGHDYCALPVGVTDELELKDGRWVARGRFAPESANPFAQQVRRLYDAGIVRAASVGIIVREIDGKRLTKSELLEWSFVPVPANGEALSVRKVKELGLDTGMLAMKGMPVAEKAEGDTCSLEDGAEGVIDAEGNCVPKVTEASQKGELSDALTEEEMWEKKWNNLHPLCDIFDAFFNVYLDNETPVEKFGELVGEMIALLQPLATTAEAKTALKEVIEKNVADRTKYAARKGEAVMTETEKAQLAEKLIQAIKGSAGSDRATGGSGTENRVSDSPNQRSESAGGNDSENLKEFLAGRQVLREVATIVTGSLERMNKIAREKRDNN